MTKADLTSDALVVSMLLFENLTQLDFTGPYEVLTRMPNTRVELVAASLEPIRSEHGLKFLADHTFHDASQADILFVPGGRGVNDLLNHAETLQFLRQQGEKARYVTSVCTGSLLLGAAGLLKGYKATSHWNAREFLGEFGAQAVNERVVIDRNRITGAGVTSGIDFGLQLVSELFGENTAREIQLMIEYDPHPPFQGGSPKNSPRQLVEKVQALLAPGKERRVKAVRQAAVKK